MVVAAILLYIIKFLNSFFETNINLHDIMKYSDKCSSYLYTYIRIHIKLQCTFVCKAYIYFTYCSYTKMGALSNTSYIRCMFFLCLEMCEAYTFFLYFTFTRYRLFSSMCMDVTYLYQNKITLLQTVYSHRFSQFNDLIHICEDHGSLRFLGIKKV